MAWQIILTVALLFCSALLFLQLINLENNDQAVPGTRIFVYLALLLFTF